MIVICFHVYMYKACKDGFIGDNCLTKCPQMYFGPGCTSECNCTKDQCHHVTGCLQSPSKGTCRTLLNVSLYNYFTNMVSVNFYDI